MFDLRPPAVAGYIGLWILVLYHGDVLPSLSDRSAVIAAIMALGAAHLALGVVLSSWWACALAVVPPLVAAPGVDEWPLLIYYVPPIAVLIGLGVGFVRLRERVART